MFDHADFHGIRLLVVAELDLKRLIHPRRAAGGHGQAGAGIDAVENIHLKIRLLPFADEIKGIAGGYTHGFVARGVANGVFTHELQLAIAVAAIKTQFAGGQGDAELVGLRIFEFALDDNFFVVRVAEVLVVVQRVEPIAKRGVININRRGKHLFGVNKLDLFGFPIMQRGWARNGIKMELIK